MRVNPEVTFVANEILPRNRAGIAGLKPGMPLGLIFNGNESKGLHEFSRSEAWWLLSELSLR